MSFILDENQQQHLLVILNDINRHIYEASVALANSGAAGSGGSGGSTTSNTSSAGTSPGSNAGTSPKQKSGHNRAKRSSVEDGGLPVAPDLISGFNQDNRQNLAHFVLNTNRYFTGFFKFTSSLIGHNDPPNGKGKSIRLWLCRFYNKILFENLNFEQIFDNPPQAQPMESSSASGSTSGGPSSGGNPSGSDHQQQQQISSVMGSSHASKKDHLLQKNKQQSAVLLNGGNGPGGPVASPGGGGSGSNQNSNSQNQTGNSNGPQHKDHDLEMMTRAAAVHLHELANPGQQQQQLYSNLGQQQGHDPNNGQGPQGPNVTSNDQLQIYHQQQQHQLDQVQHQHQAQHAQQHHALLYQTFSQILKDLTFLILLIIYLFYKLRHIFPSLINRFDISWKFFTDFERQLDPSFLHDNFMEFLQLELSQQKAVNERRTEALRLEVVHLEKMSQIVEKEIEAEIGRLVQAQSRTVQQKAAASGGPAGLGVLPHGSIIGGTSVRGSSAAAGAHGLSTSVPGTISLLDLKALKLAGGSGTTSSATSGIPLGIAAAASSGSSGGGRICPECGKSFRNTYKLNRHLFVHKDPSEKPFLCEWTGCTYRSISRNDLNRHRMIHTGEKPYLCEVDGCEKRYSRPDKLRHHKQTVHFKEAVSASATPASSAKKDFICIYPGCNFACMTKAELNRHQFDHGSSSSATLKDLEKGQQQQHQLVKMSSGQLQQVQSHQQQQSITSADLASVIASASVLQQGPGGGTILGQGQHSLQPQQHLMQQGQQQQHHQPTQGQQQGTISVPLSMLTNHSGQTNQTITSLGHQHLNLSGLTAAEGSRLAAVAAVAAGQQSQQTHHLDTTSGQVVVVPSLGQHITTISSVPISAVVSSPIAGQQQGQGQQNGQQQQQQRLNTISVWSN